jgi:hypothetical protein
MGTRENLRAAIALVRACRRPQPGEVAEATDAAFAVMVAEGVHPAVARNLTDELTSAASELAAALAGCRPQAERLAQVMKTIDALAEKLEKNGDEK